MFAMHQTIQNYRDRDFWIHENQMYAVPNFRLRKCARLLERMMGGRPYELLDVGCGPATLRTLLPPDVKYYGMDIAIHEPAPYLVERDFGGEPIAMNGQTFDVVVALGVFEYMGERQAQKFEEIRKLLKVGGTFILSYINFQHVRRIIYPIYNNVQPIDDLRRSLERVFRVERCFPVSHHWRHKQPGRNALPGVQLRMHWNIPLVSRQLAVEYFCICKGK
jgi:SAM-dependent methyltransferase